MSEPGRMTGPERRAPIAALRDELPASPQGPPPPEYTMMPTTPQRAPEGSVAEALQDLETALEDDDGTVGATAKTGGALCVALHRAEAEARELEHLRTEVATLRARAEGAEAAVCARENMVRSGEELLRAARGTDRIHEAYVEAWSHLVSGRSDPDYDVPEYPEGFPSPGAGFCRGLGGPTPTTERTRVANIESGANLKAARSALGMTQRELATTLDYEPETISRWENNAKPIPKVARLAVSGMLSAARGDSHPGQACAAVERAPLTDGEARLVAPILAAQSSAWPIYPVLVKLADAADVLLGRYSCDLHGYEEVIGARDSARAMVAATGIAPEDFTARFAASRGDIPGEVQQPHSLWDAPPNAVIPGLAELPPVPPGYKATPSGSALLRAKAYAGHDGRPSSVQAPVDGMRAEHEVVKLGVEGGEDESGSAGSDRVHAGSIAAGGESRKENRPAPETEPTPTRAWGREPEEWHPLDVDGKEA